MIDAIKVTNNSKGVIVLADIQNTNHINLLPSQSHTFFEYQYKMYERNMVSRLNSGLLKKEIVKIEQKPLPETMNNSEVLAKEETQNIEEAQVDLSELAGIDEEPIQSLNPQKKKKKKDKHKKFN